MSTKFAKDIPRRASQQVTSNPQPPPPAPVAESEVAANRTIWIIVAIIVAILIILIIVWLIWALTWNNNNNNNGQCVNNSQCGTNQVCVNGQCIGTPNCSSVPSPPTGVTVSANEVAKTATISWSVLVGSNITSYTVYQKLNDPAVSSTNFDSKVNTTAGSTTFTGLSIGTNYFVVTATNPCGESSPSHPAVSAAACVSIPNTPSAPTVSQDSNDCTGPAQAQFVELNFPNYGLTNGGYILQGNGQIGSVSQYLVVLPQSSYGPVSSLTQTCNGLTSYHNLTIVKTWTEATITSSPIVSSGSSYTMTWNPILGADEYVIFIVGESPTAFYYYGGFSPGNTSSLVIPTQSSLIGVYGVVLGYKACDKSAVSNNTIWNLPT